MRVLVATERSLKRVEGWGATYNEHIMDMVAWGVVRHVPKEELENYKGVINYLPHLAAHNPKLKPTPVRIVFDASRTQGADRV